MSVTKDKFDDLLTDKVFFELDARLSKFNIFSAVGAERAELRHSNFLATLLDPLGNHGLGGRFLVEFLIRATKETRTKFSPADVVLNDWSNIEVRREWRSIDILLFDRVNKFVCCIENKIDSGEHGDQLSRYEKVVNEHFPEVQFPHRLFLFLTPGREIPSSENFDPIGYDIVLAATNAVHADLEPQSGTGYVLGQYIDLIGGKIMQDAEVEKLCRAIYQRHRLVLDQIIQIGKPDFIRAISDFFRGMLLAEKEKNRDFEVIGAARKHWIKFKDTALDDCGWMKKAADGGGPIVYFEFYTKYSNELTPFTLSLTLDVGDEDTVQNFRSRCGDSPFKMGRETKKTLRLWQEDLVVADDLKSLMDEEKSMEEVQEIIRERWERFKTEQLPKLREGLRQIG